MEANGGQTPKKKSFWRRTNRGFWVSMALLLVVVIYVVVTQLILVAQRPDIRSLADKVNGIWNDATLLTDEEAAALAESPEKQEAVKAQLKEELQDLFCTNSDYLDAGVDLVYSAVENEYNGMQRTEKREAVSAPADEKWNIVEDTATFSRVYVYEMDGRLYDYTTETGENTLESLEDDQQTLVISLICKKENNQWKIFRLSGLYSYIQKD